MDSRQFSSAGLSLDPDADFRAILRMNVGEVVIDLYETAHRRQSATVLARNVRVGDTMPSALLPDSISRSTIK
jgi:hypothetical protein